MVLGEEDCACAVSDKGDDDAVLMTPRAMAGKARFRRMSSMAATRAPVHAPVPGSGMATRTKSPQKAYFCTTSDFFSARISKRVTR